MSVGRRGFLRSVAVGSAACLAGCDGGAAPTPDPDAGTGSRCRAPAPVPPPALDYPSAEYFAQIAADLDAAGIGTPVVFVDLDRMNANIDAIVAGVAPHSYRIVEKSLPSLDLLAHVVMQSGSDRFLVLHLPFLPALLERFPAADVLVGKTHLTGAVASFFDGLPVGADLAAVARRVIFLADGSERLAELTALAARLGVALRVAIEIDVGLRRSGVSHPGELAPLLSMFLGASEVELAGFLGYDGHIPYGPVSIQQAWSDATAEYQAFRAVLDEPELRSLDRPDLVFNSGGSATYPMYSDPTSTPVNDVAAGGGVLRPGGYPNDVISDLQPAIFVATPVLRQYSEPGLPFFTQEASRHTLAGLQGLTIYGGGWPAFFTHPPGIQPAPVGFDPTDHVMVPNQGMVTAPASLAIRPGDWVFYHPRQSDVLFQFERIMKVEGGRLQSDQWAAYPRRY